MVLGWQIIWGMQLWLKMSNGSLAFSITQYSSSDRFFWLILMQHQPTFYSYFTIIQLFPSSSFSCFDERQIKLKRKRRLLTSEGRTPPTKPSMEPQVLVTTVTNAYVRCNKVFTGASWGTPVCHLFQRTLYPNTDPLVWLNPNPN